jgi:ketosteroid isomerase-like protein
MSQENVEIAREMFAAAARAINLGEFDDLDGLLDPEVEWIPINAALEGGWYRGHGGVRQWIKDMNRDWDYFEARPEEFRNLGDDRLLAFGTWRARGRSSGVELDSQPAAWLIQLRNGKVVRMQTFTERSQALKAAGLRE